MFNKKRSIDADDLATEVLNLIGKDARKFNQESIVILKFSNNIIFPYMYCLSYIAQQVIFRDYGLVAGMPLAKLIRNKFIYFASENGETSKDKEKLQEKYNEDLTTYYGLLHEANISQGVVDLNIELVRLEAMKILVGEGLSMPLDEVKSAEFDFIHRYFLITRHCTLFEKHLTKLLSKRQLLN